jgi:hypothetical protein
MRDIAKNEQAFRLSLPSAAKKQEPIKIALTALEVFKIFGQEKSFVFYRGKMRCIVVDPNGYKANLIVMIIDY